MLGLSYPDLLVIILYLGLTTVIGLRASRGVKSSGDFFMGGRKFGKLQMVAKAFGVGTRADHAVAVIGASYHGGLSGIWYQWLYIFSTPFFWLIAPIYRRLRYVTTGDFFEQRYGKAAGGLYVFIALLYFAVEIGMILRGTGTTVEALTRGVVPANAVILVSTVVFATYSGLGGLVAAVSTKLLQSLMMLILSLLVLPFAVASIGDLTSLNERLGDAAFALVSSTSEVTFWFVVMITINGLVGIVAMPHHMAIGGAGKTEISCRTGWTYGNVMKRFVTLAWAFTGMYAAAMFPGIDPGVREQAFGVMLLNLLPAGLIGLVIAAMLASLMAVCDAYMVDGAALFTRNVYGRFAGSSGDESHQLRVARFSSFGVVAAGIVVALLLSDVVSGLAIVWKIMAFLGIPFWMAVFWRRGNRYGLWTSVIVTTALATYTGSLGWGLADQIALYLPAGVISFVAASLLTRPEPAERIHAFYTLLHTPVGEEAALKAAGVATIMEGSAISASVDDPSRSLEEQGHGLLLADLLSLHRTFSFRRYRVDLLGFLAAAAMILAIIGLAMLLSFLGTGGRP